jgi:hypothetical protein
MCGNASTTIASKGVLLPELVDAQSTMRLLAWQAVHSLTYRSLFLVAHLDLVFDIVVDDRRVEAKQRKIFAV